MIDTTLVIGLAGSGKSRLIDAWRSAGPRPRRWAVLRDQGDTFKLPRATDPQQDVADPAIESMGGCACCTGRLSVRSALGRLLRRGPWEHLLIELSGSGHPAAFVDVLRSSELAQALRLSAIVAVVDAARFEERLAGRHAPWLREQIECADRVVLRYPVAVSEAERRALADRVRALNPFDLEIEHWSPPAAESFAASSAVQPFSPFTVPAWPAEGDVVQVGQEAMSSCSGLVAQSAWMWRAAPELIFDRARVAELLARLSATPRSDRIEAVFRSEREWYRWIDGRLEPCAWRRDSRVRLSGARPGDAIDRNGLLAALRACRLS